MKKTKYFVIDTNSLLSAAMIENSVNAKALNKVFKTGQLIFSIATFSELSDVLYRPKFDKYFSLERRNSILDRFEQDGLLLEVNEQIHACRDPKDNKFLELAMSAHATCIITGDKDLLVLHPFQEIPIVTPADFLAMSF